jgi:hypothetical protein
MGARCGLGFHQSSAGAGEILGQPHHHHDPQGKDRPLNLFSKECQQQERPLRNPANLGRKSLIKFKCAPPVSTISAHLMRPHAQYTKRYDFLLPPRLRRRKGRTFPL